MDCGSSLTRLPGEMRRNTWSVIGTAFTAPGSFSACGPWAFGSGRSRYARRGKMDVRRGSSARSDVIASTMWLSSASRIFGICCARIKGITTRGRTHLSLCKDAPIPRAVRQAQCAKRNDAAVRQTILASTGLHAPSFAALFELPKSSAKPSNRKRLHPPSEAEAYDFNFLGVQKHKARRPIAPSTPTHTHNSKIISTKINDLSSAATRFLG